MQIVFVMMMNALQDTMLDYDEVYCSCWYFTRSTMSVNLLRNYDWAKLFAITYRKLVNRTIITMQRALLCYTFLVHIWLGTFTFTGGHITFVAHYNYKISPITFRRVWNFSMLNFDININRDSGLNPSIYCF